MNEIISVGFADTLVRLFICMLVNWVIVHFLYFKKGKRRDFYFTFVIISMAIFFLVYLMMGLDGWIEERQQWVSDSDSSASSASCVIVRTLCQYVR